ncbi:hypothetical protein Sjap_010713 [Stephania japonica]|uniref:Uncharacterized protein n=1 Tax=Stephania japonica TaxID=461633 RepID=A0AAP0P7E1_9MAGN
MATTQQNPFETLIPQIHSHTSNASPNISTFFFSCKFKDVSRRSRNRRTLNLERKSISCCEIGAVDGRNEGHLSAWDEKPYLVLPGGGRAYLDEQDVVAFIDPPKELIPLDSSSFNPAAYLWKKIGDIPEERRHRLLYLLKPRLISKLWEIAGTRYEVSNLINKSASRLLSDGGNTLLVEFWNCRKTGGPVTVAWIDLFKKAIFRGQNGQTYGRLIIGGSILGGVANLYSPLYFKTSKCQEVMATEQPCDLAYEFGDGLLDLNDYPQGFPTPVKHTWPFNDYLVMYLRHVGPGVMVAQAWQEGKSLKQLPKKFCGEILMVRDYAAN